MLLCIIKAKSDIQEAKEFIDFIQRNCLHANCTKINKADTGNCDKSDDSYWRECHCQDCDKQWNEDQ